MIPIRGLLSRILWDKEFGRGQFELGYFDRYERVIQRVALHEIIFPEDDRHAFQVVDESGQLRKIPLHRVREVVKDGRVIWRRQP